MARKLLYLSVAVAFSFGFFVPKAFAGAGGVQITETARTNQSVEVRTEASFAGRVKLEFDPQIRNESSGRYVITLHITPSEDVSNDPVQFASPTVYTIDNPVHGYNHVSVNYIFHTENNEERNAFDSQYGLDFYKGYTFWFGERYLPVQDGEMEEVGMQFWTRYSKPTVMEKIARKDFISDFPYASNEMGLHIASGNWNAGVQQRFLKVLPGHSYELRMKYLSTAKEFRVVLGNNDSSVDFQNRADILYPTTEQGSADYVRYFTVPQNLPGDFRLVLMANTGDVFIEGLEIKDVADPDYFDDWTFSRNRLLRDPAMELHGLAHWRHWGTTNLTEKRIIIMHSLEGDFDPKVLYMDTRGTGAGIQQMNVPVEAGKTYRLRINYFLVSGELFPKLGIRDSNVDFEGKNVRIHRPSVGHYDQREDWQYYERIFTVPQNFTNDFRVVLPMRNGEVYIDSIFLDEVI